MATITTGSTHSLQEIDCKLDLLNHLDSLERQDEIDHLSAERLRYTIRRYHGNALFVLYLLWVQGIKKQRAIATLLDISAQRVSKIVRDDLASLRAVLMFSTSGTGDPVEHDPWIYARDVVYDETDDGDTVLHSDGDPIGSVAILKSYERTGREYLHGRNDAIYHGETNPQYEARRKHPDDIAFEAIREFHREQKREQRLRAKAIEKNSKSFADGG